MEILRKLIENRVDLNQGDYDLRTAMHMVSFRKPVPILYSANVVYIEFNRALNFTSVRNLQAALKGRTNVIELLLTSNADVNPRDRFSFLSL